MIRKLYALLVLGLVVTTSSAERLAPGSPAPKFTNLPRAILESGRRVTMSLSDFKDKDVLVICVTCNHCPIAALYEKRLISFQKRFANKSVAFVAVSVSTNRADRLEQMDIRAMEKGFAFPYLYDQTQTLGRALGAEVTPEFFVFNKERKLIYVGAMDDSKVVRNQEKKRIELTSVTKAYLIDAVHAGLEGKMPAVTKTTPFGCSVQYKSKD